MHSKSPKQRSPEGNVLFGQTSIRETVLDVSVEGRVIVDGMETTAYSLHKIDQHLKSIAQSLNVIAGALAVMEMRTGEEK